MGSTGRRYLTTRDAAEYLSLTTQALETMRSRGIGPRYSRLGGGKNVRYIREDLDSWAQGGPRPATEAKTDSNS